VEAKTIGVGEEEAFADGRVVLVGAAAEPQAAMRSIAPNAPPARHVGRIWPPSIQVSGSPLTGPNLVSFLSHVRVQLEEIDAG
jgi:hypothetical protein